MDRYDPALIADLAAGLLPEPEARAAEASLTPEGRTELAAQRAVLAAIADEAPVQMTDLERAQLHRSVAAGIADVTRELSPVAVAAPSAAPRRRSVVWMRVASAAAAVALFVGVVAIGSQLTAGSDGDASADPALRAPTTAADGASAGADLSTTTAAALSASEMGDMDAGGGDARPESLRPEDQALAMLEEAPALKAAPRESDLAALADFATGMVTTQRNTTGSLSSLPCYDVAAEDDDLAIADSFRVPYPGEDGEELYAIAFADEGTATAKPLVRLYDPESCEPLADTTGSP